MKMERIVCSETSAISTQTPGKYPKENTLHIKHGESLKSRIHNYIYIYYNIFLVWCNHNKLNSNYHAIYTQGVSGKIGHVLNAFCVEQNKEKHHTNVCPRTICLRMRGSAMRRGASSVTVQGWHCDHLLRNVCLCFA
jgi:hypothetical protein